MNADNEPQLGIPSESFGDFSIGSWLFTFYAYKAVKVTADDSYDFTVTDDDSNTTYYTVGDKYYDGSGYTTNTTTLNSSNSTVDVYVDLVLESEYGGIMLYGLSFVDLSGSAYTLDTNDYTLGYSLVSADAEESDDESITYLSDSELESALGDSKDSGVSLVLSSDSSDSDETDEFTLEPGSYTLSVYAFTGDEDSDYEKIAYSTITLNVRAGIYTYVTGTLPEVTVEAVVGNISVYADETTAIYTLNDNVTVDDYTEYGYISQNYYSLTDPSDGVSEYEIDLNGNTLSIASNGNTLVIEDGSTVTIKNGTLETYVTSASGTNTASLLVKNGTLVLESVTYAGGPSVLYVDDEGTLTVTNSTITATGNYAISTNASLNYDDDGNSYYDNANITVTNSTITATDTADSTAILYNVAGKLTITGSTITGGRQAVLARMGTISISDSTLASLAKYSPTSVQYVDSTWKGGNEVPYCTLVVGNRQSNAYTGDTTCTVTNTVITMESGTNNTGIVYVAADNGYTTTFTYSGVTGSFGDTKYTSDDNIIGSNYYKSDSSTLKVNDSDYSYSSSEE